MARRRSRRQRPSFSACSKAIHRARQAEKRSDDSSVVMFRLPDGTLYIGQHENAEILQALQAAATDYQTGTNQNPLSAS